MCQERKKQICLYKIEIPTLDGDKTIMNLDLRGMKKWINIEDWWYERYGVSYMKSNKESDG